MKKFIGILLSVIMTCAVFSGCGSKSAVNEPVATQASNAVSDIPVFGDEIETTDYSKSEHWLNIPNTDYAVDVFYLYPTAWTRNEGEPVICEIDNKSMLDGAALMYKAQATAFETVGNIYAPYYRQLDAVWLLEKPLENQDKYFTGVPYADAVAAFEYYLEHYNNGRPFILAGHSQGSSIIKSIVKYYMNEHPDVYEKMIAAYVIGYFVTDDELKEYPHMKFAEAADDTGVIVSWNVEAPNITENPLAPKGSVSINPINWKRDETPASKEENLGSEIFKRAEASITHMDKLADATVDLERGTVVCSTVDIEAYAPGGTGLFPRGVYHAQDYGFYYHNIRENAKTRIEAYLSEN